MREEHRHYRLNLARRPFVNTTVPMLVALLAVAALIAFSAFNATVFFGARADAKGYHTQIESTGAEMDLLRSEIADVTTQLQEAHPEEIRGELNYANELIIRRSLSWTRLFDRLEELVPIELKMLRISPVVRGQRVELNWRVQVPRQEVIRTFISTLESSPYFDDVRLRSETPAESGNGSVWEMTVAYHDEK
jgi:Tfp pilus assembly protein PilN